MDFRILGPLEVVRDSDPLPLGGKRARSVLAVLVVFAGETVPTSSLVEEVWGGRHPRTAIDTLQSYLSRLRRVLDPALARGARSDLLVTHRSGYELRTDTDRIDARRFERQIAQARAARGQGSFRRAADGLRTALELWRGRALHDLETGPLVRAEVERLHDLRLAVLEERIEADLALGLQNEVVGELQALVRMHPLRENMRALLMLALYRAGRQAEALDAFTEARAALVEGLGVEPGRRLQRLQGDILAHSPELEGPGPSGPTETEGRPAGMRLRADAGNLPIPLDSFVGRGNDRATIAAQLASSRLVTLTGAGGCGKSRLAYIVGKDAAEAFPGGVWVVRFDGAHDGESAAEAVALALGVPIDGRPLTDAIMGHLPSARSLLILDDCDHVLESAAELAETLLVRCRDLCVLATSRQALGIAGEAVRAIRPLPLPPAEVGDIHTVSDNPAGALFCDRARSVQPDFTLDECSARDVTRVCRAVDGIPLAIEVAARELRLLSVGELADRLERSLALLGVGTSTAPARHRGLTDLVAWSYRRLGEPEQALLNRLSVFPGTFTIDAVEALCTEEPVGPGGVLPALRSLVDRSLVEPERSGTGPARHRLLATTRSYVSPRLASGEAKLLAKHHAAFYTNLAEEARPHLTGSDQVAWLNRLHAEQGNLLAAMDWMLSSGAVTNALGLAGAVWWFWLQFGHAAEGYRWLVKALDAVAEDTPIDLRQEALYAAGTMAATRADTARGRECLQASLALAERRRDRRAAALSLGGLALLETNANRSSAAARYANRSLVLARDIDDTWCVARSEHTHGTVAAQLGQLDDAMGAFFAGMEGYLAAGDEWTACLPRLGAARVARQRGSEREAAALHKDNLARSMELTVTTFDFIGPAPDVQELAALACGVGRHELAATLVGGADQLWAVGDSGPDATWTRERGGTLAAAREAVGERRADAALRRGREMPPAEALAYALDAAGSLA